MSWIKGAGKVCGECAFSEGGYCVLKHITVKEDRMACSDFDM